jgi:two-component system, chemotaxis family, protein-glutamate methylesterase/glutaminase
MPLIKVLIVDDSALVRQAYKVLLETDPEIKVIGTASDPYIAVHKIQKEKPDVITLDIEMPRMDGLTFLKKIMSQAPMPVIVISNRTQHGADSALLALEAGAVDVLSKPDLGTDAEIEDSRITLIDKVRSAYFSKKRESRVGVPLAAKTPGARMAGSITPGTVIAIGASTGGTEALKTFLTDLPETMPPIVVVQHMPAGFTKSFAQRLDDVCSLKVKEAVDKEVLMNGTVYIAPGGRHMSLRSSNGSALISVFDGELVNRHRPSVNVLFDSVAEVKGKNAIGIIMTGMGDDGASGLKAMRERGAYTIAQDEATSVVFGMPQKAILAGAVSDVLPLPMISKTLCERIFN